MKVKTSAILAHALALLVVGSTWANPLHLPVEDVTDATAQAMGLSVCNIYTQYNYPTDFLFYVAFADITTNDPAGFYQHALGTDLAPSQTLIDMDPGLAYDSFVTVGLEAVPPGGSDTTTVDPDWDSVGFNNDGQVVGGWYNSNPTNGQGAPDENMQTLIAKLTVSTGKYTYGDVLVFYDEGFAWLEDCFTCFFCDTCDGDLNCDGYVRSDDLGALLGAWGSNPCHPADLDDDGTVNGTDQAILFGNWGACP